MHHHVGIWSWTPLARIHDVTLQYIYSDGLRLQYVGQCGHRFYSLSTLEVEEGMHVRGRRRWRAVLQKHRLTNEFEFFFVYSRTLVRVYASLLVTDCRLAQQVTPRTAYSPTPAGRLGKPRNFILYLARAGFEPTTFSTVIQCHTNRPTRQLLASNVKTGVL